MDLRGLRAGDKIMASDVELNDGLMLVRSRPLWRRCCSSSSSGIAMQCTTSRVSAREPAPPRTRRLHRALPRCACLSLQRSKVRDFAIARVMGARKGGDAGEGEEAAPAAGDKKAAAAEKKAPAK